MLNRYLSTRYVKGGRGPVEVDCWGLVRLARHELFRRPLLQAYDGADPGDKRLLTAAVQVEREAGGFVPVPARPGAIATAWRARLCVHVGLAVEADGRLWVLETDEATGPCLTPIPAFASRYTKVIFYDDQNLS